MSSRSISSNFLWKFAERFLAQIVSFVVSLILARLLLPEEYGVVALVLVFIEIANVFVSAGLGNALIQKKESDQLDFSSVFYFNFSLSIALYGILFFTAPLISSFYENVILTPILRVFGIRIIFASFNSVQHAYVSKEMVFKKFFLATLAGTIVSGVAGILMAYKGFGAWALVAQYLINTIIDTLVLFVVVRWKPSLMFSWKRLGGLFRFGWKILFEGLSNTIFSRLYNLIIGKVYTSSDLGYYTKAQQFPSLFMTNINASISAVLFPSLSKIQDNDERMVFTMRKAVKVSSYILFPMLLGICAVADNMVTVLLTDKWSGCVPYIYIFCIINLITVGMYSRHEALKAKGRSDVFMVEHIFARIISLVLLLLFFRISVLAIALTSVFSSLILAAIIMFTSSKYTGYKFIDQIKDITLLLFMSGTMFLLTYKIGIILDLYPVIELIIQILIGFLVYLALSIIIKPEGYLFVVKYLKSFFKRGKNQ